MSKTDIATLKAGQSVAELKPKDQLKYLIDKNRAAIEAVIPRHLTRDRLLMIAQTAVTKTPKLLECYMPSVLKALIGATELGLEPNTPLGQAFLIPFKNRNANRMECQLIIGYQGLMDLARRSDRVGPISAYPVYANDDFSFQYGTDAFLKHIPILGEGVKGDIIAFYGVAELKDGFTQFEVMSRSDVDRIMRGTPSKGEYGPWSDDYIEMGRKTAVRRLCKYLPRTPELAKATALDEQAERGDTQDFGHIIDADYEMLAPDDAEPQAEPDKKPANKKKAAKKTAKQTAPRVTARTGPQDEDPGPNQEAEPTQDREPGSDDDEPDYDAYRTRLAETDDVEVVNVILNEAKVALRDEDHTLLRIAAGKRIDKIMNAMGME